MSEFPEPQQESAGPFLKGPISIFSQAAALSSCGSENSHIRIQAT